MSSVGAPELVIILLVCVLIFGGSKLPKLARSIGEAKAEFEKSSSTTPSTDAKDEQVTMTNAELTALLDEREAAARRSESVTMTKTELDELLAAKVTPNADARQAAGPKSEGGVTSAEDRTTG